MGNLPKEKDRPVYSLSSVKKMEDNSIIYNKYFSPSGWKQAELVHPKLEQAETSFECGVYDVTKDIADIEYIDNKDIIQITNSGNYQQTDGLFSSFKPERTPEQIKNGEFSIIDSHGDISQSKLGDFLNRLDNWHGLSRLPMANKFIPNNPLNNDSYELHAELNYSIFPNKTYDIKNNSSLIIPEYNEIIVEKDAEMHRVGEVRYVISTSELGRNINLLSTYDKDTNSLYMENIPLNMRYEGNRSIVIYVNGIRYLASGSLDDDESAENRWSGNIVSGNNNNFPESWEKKYISVTEIDSKYSKDSLIRKSRVPFLDFDMISYDSEGKTLEYLESQLEVPPEYALETSKDLLLERRENISDQLKPIIDLMNKRDLLGIGYNILDPNENDKHIWESGEEDNIEECVVKINNSWLPSTSDPAKDNTNELDYNIGTYKVNCLSDPLGYDKWGRIFTEDRLPKTNPDMNQPSGVVIGTQIRGRGAPEELSYNPDGNLVTEDSHDFDENTRIKRSAGYLDYPLYYKLTSQTLFSDIFKNNEQNDNQHLYPVFDTTTAGTLNKSTLDKSMLKDGNTLYNNVHELSEISSILRVADGNTELDDKNDINDCTTNRFMDRFAQDYINKVKINVKNTTGLQFSDYYKDKTDFNIKRKRNFVLGTRTDDICRVKPKSINYYTDESVGGGIYHTIGAADEHNYHILDGFDINIPNVKTLEGQGFDTQIKVHPGEFNFKNKYDDSFLHFNSMKLSSNLRMNQLENYIHCTNFSVDDYYGMVTQEMKFNLEANQKTINIMNGNWSPDNDDCLVAKLLMDEHWNENENKCNVTGRYIANMKLSDKSVSEKSLLNTDFSLNVSSYPIRTNCDNITINESSSSIVDIKRLKENGDLITSKGADVDELIFQFTKYRKYNENNVLCKEKIYNRDNEGYVNLRKKTGYLGLSNYNNMNGVYTVFNDNTNPQLAYDNWNGINNLDGNRHEEISNNYINNIYSQKGTSDGIAPRGKEIFSESGNSIIRSNTSLNNSLEDTFRIDVFPKTQFDREKYPYILDTELDNKEDGKIGIGGYSTIPRLVNKGNVYTDILSPEMITSHRQTILLDDNGDVMRDSNGNLQTYDYNGVFDGEYKKIAGNCIKITDKIYQTKDDDNIVDWDIVHISNISYTASIKWNADLDNWSNEQQVDDQVLDWRKQVNTDINGYVYPNEVQLEQDKLGDNILVDYKNCVGISSILNLINILPEQLSFGVKTVPINISVSKMVSAPISLFDDIKQINNDDSMSLTNIQDTIVCEDWNTQLDGNPSDKPYVWGAKPESNNNPLTLPAATGDSLVQYLKTQYKDIYDNLQDINPDKLDKNDSNVQSLFRLLDIDLDILDDDSEDVSNEMESLKESLEKYMNLIEEYKTNKYIGYVVRCSKHLTKKNVQNKETHIKYTVFRDRLALGKEGDEVSIVDINNNIFGYDLSKHTTTSTNIVYDKEIDLSTTNNNSSIELNSVGGIFTGIENSDINGNKLRIGIPKWNDSYETKIYSPQGDTFKIESSTSNKIGIHLSNNITFECVKISSESNMDTYKIIELNGRPYNTNVDCKDYPGFINESMHIMNDITDYYSIIRYEENNGIDLCVELSLYSNLIKKEGERINVNGEDVIVSARGRCPMYITNKNNSYTQNQEYCNRALHLWTGDAHKIGQNVLEDSELSSTNYRYYNIDENGSMNVTLFKNIDDANMVGNVPINIVDELLYEYYWTGTRAPLPVDIINTQYNITIDRYKLKDISEIEQIIHKEEGDFLYNFMKLSDVQNWESDKSIIKSKNTQEIEYKLASMNILDYDIIDLKNADGEEMFKLALSNIVPVSGKHIRIQGDGVNRTVTPLYKNAYIQINNIDKNNNKIIRVSEDKDKESISLDSLELEVNHSECRKLGYYNNRKTIRLYGDNDIEGDEWYLFSRFTYFDKNESKTKMLDVSGNVTPHNSIYGVKNYVQDMYSEFGNNIQCWSTTLMPVRYEIYGEKINPMDRSKNVRTMNYSVSNNPIVLDVQKVLMGGNQPNREKYFVQYMMDENGHSVYVLPNNYVPANYNYVTIINESGDEEYHQIVEMTQQDSILKRGVYEQLEIIDNWKQGSDEQYKLFKVVNKINGRSTPSYKTEEVVIVKVDNDKDIYNLINMTDFGKEVASYPFSFNGKTTEHAESSKNSIKENIGVELTIDGINIKKEIVEVVYPISKYSITSDVSSNPNRLNNTGYWNEDKQIFYTTDMKLSSNSVQLVEDELLDENYRGVHAPSIQGLNTHFKTSQIEEKYNFKHTGMHIHCKNTAGNRTLKSRDILNYNSEEYDKYNFKSKDSILMPMNSNILSNDITDNYTDEIVLSGNETNYTMLENAFYDEEKWIFNNNTLTRKDNDGNNIQENITVEILGNKMILNNFKLETLSESIIQKKQIELYKTNIQDPLEIGSLKDTLVKILLTEDDFSEAYDDLEELLFSMAKNNDKSDAKENEDTQKSLIELINERIENLLNSIDESETYPNLNEKKEKIRETIITHVMSKIETMGNLHLKKIEECGLPVYILDEDKVEENIWYINRFGINNAESLTVNVILDIDEHNKINHSDTQEKQNHLKDIIHFHSATNNALYRINGSKAEDIKMEYYDKDTNVWKKRTEPISSYYNTARLSYKADDVEVRTMKKQDILNPDLDSNGTLLQNQTYHLITKDNYKHLAVEQQVLKDWSKITDHTYYTGNSYIYKKRRNEMFVNLDIGINSGQLHFPAGQNYGRLSANRPDDTLMKFEINSPKIEYTYTTRTYESQSVGYKRDEEGNFKEDTFTVDIPSTHIVEKIVGSEKVFEYYLNDLYISLVSKEKLDFVDSLFTYDVNCDKLSLGYSTDIRNQPSEKNTVMINEWDELKHYKFVDLFKNNGKSNEEIVVHGSLCFRNLYRLNARLPMLNKVDDNSFKVTGLKSINRMNVLESEMIVSMWNNVRTVRGVERDVIKLSQDDETNDTEKGKLLHHHLHYQNTQIGFADRQIIKDEKDVDKTVYSYKEPTNHDGYWSHYDVDDVEQSMENTLDGKEIISVTNSKWELYAVSLPYTIGKSNNKHKVRPKICYNLSDNSSSSENVLRMLHMDPSINSLERNRINYLKENNCFNSDGSINMSLDPDGLNYPPILPEVYMGIVLNFTPSFDFSSNKVYIVDTYECPKFTNLYEDGSPKFTTTEEKGQLQIMETQKSREPTSFKMKKLLNEKYNNTYSCWDETVAMDAYTRKIKDKTAYDEFIKETINNKKKEGNDPDDHRGSYLSHDSISGWQANENNVSGGSSSSSSSSTPVTPPVPDTHEHKELKIGKDYGSIKESRVRSLYNSSPNLNHYLSLMNYNYIKNNRLGALAELKSYILSAIQQNETDMNYTGYFSNAIDYETGKVITDNKGNLMTNRDVLKAWWLENRKKLGNIDILSMILPIINPEQITHETDTLLGMYYANNDSGKGIQYRSTANIKNIKGYTNINIMGYPKDNYIKLIDENDVNSETRNHIANKWMYNGGNILPRISYLFNRYILDMSIKDPDSDIYDKLYNSINRCFMEIATDNNYNKLSPLYFNREGTALSNSDLEGYFTKDSINNWKD